METQQTAHLKPPTRTERIAGKQTSAGERRLCSKCDALMLSGEPDACLGTLPGVSAACCGHGVVQGYILFVNGLLFSFDDFIEAHKDHFGDFGFPNEAKRHLITKEATRMIEECEY